MTKTNDATRKPQTHFEQVPLEVVKKIAKEDAPKDHKAGIDRGAVKPTAKGKPQRPPAGSLERNGR